MSLRYVRTYEYPCFTALIRRNNVVKPRTKVNCSLINERLCCHQHCCLRTRTCQVARDPLTPLALTLDLSLFLPRPFFVPPVALYAQGSDALLESEFSRQACTTGTCTVQNSLPICVTILFNLCFHSRRIANTGNTHEFTKTQDVRGKDFLETDLLR